MKNCVNPHPLRRAVCVWPVVAFILALSVVGLRAAATLQLEFKYDDSGTISTNGGLMAGAALTMRNAADVPTDLHGAPGTGLRGGSDRAFDLTAATGMGANGVGPWGAVANSGIASGSSWTAATWYRTTTAALGTSARVLAAGNDATCMLGGGAAAGDGRVFASTGTVNATNGYPESASWIFMATTFSDGNVLFYKGSLSDSVALVAGPFSIGTGAANPLSIANSVSVGNRSTRNRPFQGYLDNTRFWNDGGAGDASGALSLADLEQIRASDVAAVAPSALVLTNARVVGNQFVFDVWGGDAGVVIQRSTNSTQWTDWQLLGATNLVQDAIPSGAHNTFYRGRWNQIPTAQGDAFILGKNAVLSQPAPGVLANDVDADGGPLTALLASGPAHGTLELNGDGAFIYAPVGDYFGADSFTYRASDGFATSGVATVTLTITNGLDAPPVASNDVFTAMENTTLVIPAGGVLTNDSDPEGNILAALLATGPTNGTLSLSTNGGFTYTPNTRYFGPDSFTYRATDGMLTSGVATVSLNVAMAYATSGSNVLRYGAPFEWRGANKMDVFGGSPSSMTPWGMDIVREPIDMLLTSTSTMQTIVNNARAAGKVTILCAMWYDNDAFAGGTTPYPDCQLLGSNPTSDPRWAAVTNRWREIANQFKGQSDVWFDVWNEPYWYDDSHGYSDALWLSDMSLLVDNIRSTGARNICLVPGSATGQGHQVFINQGANLLVGRSNILFQIHCYQYKWNVSQATVESRFQAVLNAGCPLLIGEYGAGDPFANILNAARTKKVSTVAWLWKNSNSDVEALLRSDGLTPNDVGNNGLGSGVRAFCLEQRNGANGPAAPTGLSATPQSGTRINLAWTDNATDESGYTVERSTNGGAWVPIVNLAANTTSYSNTSLTSGTTYSYRVIAYTPTGGSGYSNTASANTP